MEHKLKLSAETPVDAALAEQRSAPRFTLMLRQARLKSAQGQFLCVVRDISQTGIRVKVFHPLPRDPHMAIEVSETRSVAVERVWQEGGEAGFRFVDPLDLESFLTDSPEFPRRQFRVDLELPILLRSGLMAVEARTINVSQQGACISCAEPLARHRLVRLESGVLPDIHAKVLWRQGEIHGLVFEDTFSFREFAVALGRLQGMA